MAEDKKETSFSKELETIAKNRGLEIAEDSAQQLAHLGLDVLAMVIAKSKNKFDDIAWTAMEGTVRKLVNEFVDKIDGKEG